MNRRRVSDTAFLEEYGGKTRIYLAHRARYGNDFLWGNHPFWSSDTHVVNRKEYLFGLGKNDPIYTVRDPRRTSDGSRSSF